MTVNLARYRPSGEHVAIRRIDLEFCTNDMVTFLQVCVLAATHPPFLRRCVISVFPPHQGELHVSKLFHHPSILPYKSVFIAENELWVITPFMAYGEETRRRFCRVHHVHHSPGLIVTSLMVFQGRPEI